MRHRERVPRVAIASRVFEPEAAAASFRLGAVADALAEAGAQVEALTASVPGSPAESEARVGRGAVRVVRWPVLRDSTGYVRGYLPYLSFDVPLFFRLLVARRPNVVLVEPPPTTGLVARIALGLRRVPYVWYAADVWSDATEIAGAPRLVASVVRAMERFTLRGAAGVIAVSDGVADRVRTLGAENVKVVRNGIDTGVYDPAARPLEPSELAELGVDAPYLLYAGTASEWQGASVFAEAVGDLTGEFPDLQLVYVGQGAEWDRIEDIAAGLERTRGRRVVVQVPPQSPEMVARLLVGSSGALVSIVPDKGYDFAYPTKVLAALSAGVPVLYAGKGPVAEDIEVARLGAVADYSPESVASGMRELLEARHDSFEPARLREWVVDQRSLAAAAREAAAFLRSVGEGESTDVARGEPRPPSAAVVTPWYPHGGAETEGLFVQREVDALRAEGADVRVVHLDRSLPPGQVQRELRGDLRVLRVGMNPANPASVAKAAGPLRAALRGVDVVHSHAVSALPVVAVARGKKPWVHTEHWSALSSPDSASPLLRAVRPAFGTLLRLPDLVVAESERLAAPIRRFRGNRPVELIPCIVPGPDAVQPWPGGEVLRLASTGGVIERKGPLLAVRALAALRARGIEASLVWTGEGHLREEALELAKTLGVDAEFPGAGTPEEVAQRLAEADMFIGPTQGENFFVAAAEALVAGRPVVASDQGGHVEYADPAFAEIVTEQTPDAYAEAIVRLREKLVGADAGTVAASVASRFTGEAVANRYLAVYEDLIT